MTTKRPEMYEWGVDPEQDKREKEYLRRILAPKQTLLPKSERDRVVKLAKDIFSKLK